MYNYEYKIYLSYKIYLLNPVNNFLQFFSLYFHCYRGGIKFLIDLRKDVLTQMKTLDPTSQEHKEYSTFY